MPHDLALAERVRDVLSRLYLSEDERITEKRMFGGLCFLLNDRILLSLLVRLSDTDYAVAENAGQAVPMNLTGRTLRNFAYLVEGTWDTDEDLLTWIEQSAAFVRAHMYGKPLRKPRPRRSFRA